MDSTDELRSLIYNNMQLKTTEDLLLILEHDDREEWSDLAFEVVKQILVQRTGKHPVTPADIRAATGKPVNLNIMNWKDISTQSDEAQIIWKIFYILFASISLLAILTGIFILPSSKIGRIGSVLFVLLGFFFFVNSVFSYVRIQTAERIISRSRVVVKPPKPRRRRFVYEVVFSNRSPCTLSKNGELIANNKWNGHNTLSVPYQIFDRINENDVVDLMFLSSGHVLGLRNKSEEDR